MKKLIILCTMGLSLNALAIDVSTEAKDVTCKSGSDERKLTIITKDGGCELQYTKGSDTSIKATQKLGNNKCIEISNHIKEKLIAAQFECQ